MAMFRATPGTRYRVASSAATGPPEAKVGYDSAIPDSIDERPHRFRLEFTLDGGDTWTETGETFPTRAEAEAGRRRAQGLAPDKRVYAVSFLGWGALPPDTESPEKSVTARQVVDLPEPPRRFSYIRSNSGSNWLGPIELDDVDDQDRLTVDELADRGYQTCIMEATWRPILMPIDLGGEPAPGVEVRATGDVPVRDIVETMLTLANLSAENAPVSADHLRKGARLLAALAERFERKMEEAERSPDGAFALERSVDGENWTRVGGHFFGEPFRSSITDAARRMRSLAAHSTQSFRVIRRDTGEVVAGPVDGGLGAQLDAEGFGEDGTCPLCVGPGELCDTHEEEGDEVTPAALRMAQERYDLADAVLDMYVGNEEPSDALLSLADRIVAADRPQVAPKSVDCDEDGWGALEHFERLARDGVEEMAGELDNDDDRPADVAAAIIRGVAFGMSPKLAQAMRYALDGLGPAMTREEQMETDALDRKVLGPDVSETQTETTLGEIEMILQRIVDGASEDPLDDAAEAHLKTIMLRGAWAHYRKTAPSGDVAKMLSGDQLVAEIASDDTLAVALAVKSALDSCGADWVCSDKKRLGEVVQGAVAAALEVMDPESWRHYTANVADQAAKGGPAFQLEFSVDAGGTWNAAEARYSSFDQAAAVRKSWLSTAPIGFTVRVASILDE